MEDNRRRCRRGHLDASMANGHLGKTTFEAAVPTASSLHCRLQCLLPESPRLDPGTLRSVPVANHTIALQRRAVYHLWYSLVRNIVDIPEDAQSMERSIAGPQLTERPPFHTVQAGEIFIFFHGFGLAVSERESNCCSARDARH